VQVLSIVWRVLVNLVETVVILAMFHIAKSTFETIVISALVIIYVSVVNSFWMLGLGLLEKGHQDLARFIEIARLLKYSNTEVHEEAQRENLEEFKGGRPGLWINIGFHTLFSLIAIGNLVYAIW